MERVAMETIQMWILFSPYNHLQGVIVSRMVEVVHNAQITWLSGNPVYKYTQLPHACVSESKLKESAATGKLTLTHLYATV